MYRTIKRRFEPGSIKLVTAINLLGTSISLFIVLWIYCFVSNIKMETNMNHLVTTTSQELLRGITSHGPVTSSITFFYILSKHDDKIYYLCLSIPSLWLLFTTQSIWPGLILGSCFGLVELRHSGKFPDL